MRALIFFAILIVQVLPTSSTSIEGYYRQPALHGDQLIFSAEGDLWKVGVEGGSAQRLTTHLETESYPSISPDGRYLAFSAAYEGPTEIYLMPMEGGLPRRLTYDGDWARMVGWDLQGRAMYATRHFSTLPSTQLVAVDPETLNQTPLPLAQASDGNFDAKSGTFFFTRLSAQGSSTKRYQGGTAQNIWRFEPGADEALALTPDFKGTSRHAMVWQKRVYFASDRDGTMNLWSMNFDGGDLRQHTHHAGWDILEPDLNEGRIVYQLGADLHLYDISSNSDRVIPIRLLSDLEQMRERWVDKPMDYLSATHLNSDGSRVVTTNRGRVFVHPVKQGRRVELTRDQGIRFRGARFLPESESLILRSDASGEVEWWEYSAEGAAKARQISEDGKVLRFGGIPSPDGKWIASWNQDQEMRLINVESGKSSLVAFSQDWGFEKPSWSPDSRFFAYGHDAENGIGQIFVYDLDAKESFPITSDRFHSTSPAWSADGDWIYFLSNRHFQSIVYGPWGQAQPEPFLDKQTLIYAVALGDDLRFPFDPQDELWVEPESENEEEDEEELKVEIQRDGLLSRLRQVPLDAGNYSRLAAKEGRLFWMSRNAGEWRGGELLALDFGSEDIESKSIASDVSFYELSGDASKLLLRNGDSIYVIDSSSGAGASLDDAGVDLSSWKFTVNPEEEWRQVFVESWRLMRDYFYDRNMHGVDWDAMLQKYLPLLDRVTTRLELSDLQKQMAGELSALHVYVGGGDHREDAGDIDMASLGAVLRRDDESGNWRIASIYRSDPDLPEARSPLDRPGLDIREGDILSAINGVPLESVIHPGVLLRNQAGEQVRLELRRGRRGEPKEFIVEAMPAWREYGLRYEQWELKRRERVEEAADGSIGYVHMRAMGSGDYSTWQRHFFPVFERQGLIIDVRHNGGGNIDSWILSRLMRQAWMYWSPRVGDSYWNMQYAFRGHMVVLVDEWTGSDGEAFADGFRRLGLGEVIGTRSWGGEIWLTSSNTLVDYGIVAAPEFGVYGPEGKWLIEGIGVEPDKVVDNLPHQTYLGKDAQLDAAIEHLKRLIAEDPRPVPPPPARPDKSFP